MPTSSGTESLHLQLRNSDVFQLFTFVSQPLLANVWKGLIPVKMKSKRSAFSYASCAAYFLLHTRPSFDRLHETPKVLKADERRLLSSLESGCSRDRLALDLWPERDDAHRSKVFLPYAGAKSAAAIGCCPGIIICGYCCGCMGGNFICKLIDRIRICGC